MYNSHLPPTGRMAPSPTGLLHLGNAWSFLLAWLAARAMGGRVILRHEDIDPDRSRQFWRDAIEYDLHWLGLDWDEGPGRGGPGSPYRQALCGALYEGVLERLRRKGLVYPCFCTRRELRSLAGAPHGAADGLGDAGAAYPGTCRNLSTEERSRMEAEGRHAALRLRCPDGEQGRITFHDLMLGQQSMTLAECGGDFALRRSDGVWAYQLAVVADDMRMGVTQVVRGADILPSTPRQLLLYQLLKGDPPVFAHIPLLYDSQGGRLAKRHKSLSISRLREQGIRPEAVVGWLARQAGLLDRKELVAPAVLAERLYREGKGFPWEKMPHGEITVPDNLATTLSN